jgi:hypothetical protein
MNQDERLRQIAELTEKLSDQEFHRLMGFLAAEYRTRMQRAAHRAALTLQPGDWVGTLESGRHLPRGARGRVLHLARSRIHADLGGQGIWALLPLGVKKIDPDLATVNLPTSHPGR